MTATSAPGTSLSHLVGVLGGRRVATVDAAGTVRPERGLWALEWWVGADDRWHLPRREAAVRQSLVEHMPVVRTSMRVPGGDAVHEAFGATTDTAVVDVENASPAPFVAAFVVRGATVLMLDGTTVFVDGVPALTAVRPPSRWAASIDGTLTDVVTTGGALEGSMPVVRDRRACVDGAFLYPVAHRTRVRMGVALGRRDGAGLAAVNLTAVPTPDAVARGWRAQLGRGMRVDVPDAVLADAIDASRAQLLLAGQAWRADPAVYAALEDWGFDDEALAAWARLGLIDRRRSRRRARSPAAPSWDALRRLAATESSPAELLRGVRDTLVRDEGTVISVLSEWPAEWHGRPLDVRDAPTRRGPVSCSVRWHGDRPALLWEAPPGVTLRAPGLDPAWSTTEPRGETLLSPRA
ncbi:MAG: hypothetical protein ACHQIG_06600 [Acidimicrobiia bacterium]